MTDITELAQMKGQKVEGSYYLAECTDCGKMYPSKHLRGGEALFSGDYGECYCPHCNADDAAIGDCGDAAAIAWNYQQARIDALVDALEKSQRANAAQDDHINQQQDRIEQLEKGNQYAGKRIAELESFRTAYMEWSDKTDWVNTDRRFGVVKPLGKHRADVLKEYIEHLESRTVKLPRWLVKDAIAVYDRDEIEDALTAAGIKWEAE